MSGRGPVNPVLLTPEQASFAPDRVLKFPRTDADKDKYKWPTPSEGAVNAEGQHDFHRPYHLLEERSFAWRKIVGTHIAVNVLKKPKDKTGYILDSFPEGYVFFDHAKGFSGSIRHDPYLYGPSCREKVVKFRSPNEFIPHAIWLWQNDPTGPYVAPCQCKYCSRSKTQRDISERLNLSKRQSLGLKTSVTPSPRAAPRTRKPYVQRAQASEDQPSAQALESELVADLENGRLFRKKELVWIALSHPIRSTTEDDAPPIEYWPGVVIDASPINPPESPEALGDAYQYVVQLMAVDQALCVPESQVLPYMACSHLRHLVEPQHVVKSIPGDGPSSLSPHLREWDVFQPFVEKLQPESDHSYERAIGPYTLAIDIVRQAVVFFVFKSSWTPQKLDINSRFDPVITERINGTNPNILIPTTLPAPPISPPELGKRSQGLWWGAERVWMGDLVRLFPVRKEFPSAITDHLAAPYDESELSVTRPLFLKVAVIAPHKQHQGIVAGRLFEIVPATSGLPATKYPAIGLAKAEPSKSATSSTSFTDLIPIKYGPLPLDPPPSTASKLISSSAPSTLQPAITPHVPSPFPPRELTLATEGLSAPRNYDRDIQATHTLPDPPPGFKWRLISNSNLNIPIQVMAGRYYPGILDQLVNSVGLPTVQQAVEEVKFSVKVLDERKALAGGMEGETSKSAPALLQDAAVVRKLVLGGLLCSNNRDKMATTTVSMKRKAILLECSKRSRESMYEAWQGVHSTQSTKEEDTLMEMTV